MRRVNIRHGLKQRINEILGTDPAGYSWGDAVPSITDWSIQAAVIENLGRIVSGIAGDVKGAPMNGLVLSGIGASTFAISSGFGFTNNGNIVVIESPVEGISLPVGSSSVYVYVKHSLAYLEDVTGSKETGFIGRAGEEDIIIDDLGATLGTAISADSTDVIIVGDELTGSSLVNHVYLGVLTVSGGNITVITPHGFTLNNLRVKTTLTADEDISAKNITVTDTIVLEDVTLNGTLTASSGSILTFDTGSKVNVEPAVEMEFKSGATLNLNAGTNVEVGGSAVHDADITLAGITVIHVKNGLITGTT